MAKFKVGDKVEWDWGNGTGQGKVEKTYTRKITRKISGTDVTRNGSDDNPAVFIVQSDGDEVLKLSSELRKA
ncbi:MAG: DUF2945 domain-containing protein [Rhodobacterales bacterium]